MADLEEHAVKRDKRFIVRLVLALLAGAVAGAFIYAEMTREDLGACVAKAFQGVTTDEAPASGQGGEPASTPPE